MDVQDDRCSQKFGHHGSKHQKVRHRVNMHELIGPPQVFSAEHQRGVAQKADDPVQVDQMLPFVDRSQLDAEHIDAV